jgi:hypothetical protein
LNVFTDGKSPSVDHFVAGMDEIDDFCRVLNAALRQQFFTTVMVRDGALAAWCHEPYGCGRGIQVRGRDYFMFCFSRTYRNSNLTPAWSLEIPLWPMMVMFLAYPSVSLLRSRMMRRRFRAGAGLCITCGYELCGNTSGICPECGTMRDRVVSLTPQEAAR